MSNIGNIVCSNGHSVSSGATYCPICGAAMVSSPFSAGDSSPLTQTNLLAFPRANAGARFVEWLIDYGAGIMLSIVTAGLGLFLFVCFYFINAWYEGETGQTLGKKAMNLYVIDTRTGKFIGGPSGIGRHLLHILDALPLGLGYIVGLITGRTFADRILGTIVVAKPQ